MKLSKQIILNISDEFCRKNNIDDQIKEFDDIKFYKICKINGLFYYIGFKLEKEYRFYLASGNFPNKYKEIFWMPSLFEDLKI